MFVFTPLFHPSFPRFAGDIVAFLLPRHTLRLPLSSPFVADVHCACLKTLDPFPLGTTNSSHAGLIPALVFSDIASFFLLRCGLLPVWILLGNGDMATLRFIGPLQFTISFRLPTSCQYPPEAPLVEPPYVLLRLYTGGIFSSPPRFSVPFPFLRSYAVHLVSNEVFGSVLTFFAAAMPHPNSRFCVFFSSFPVYKREPLFLIS